MKVYVAMGEVDYEGSSVLGVFSSEELAQKRCVNEKYFPIYDSFDIEEFELEGYHNSSFDTGYFYNNGKLQKVVNGVNKGLVTPRSTDSECDCLDREIIQEGTETGIAQEARVVMCKKHGRYSDCFYCNDTAYTTLICPGCAKGHEGVEVNSNET